MITSKYSWIPLLVLLIPVLHQAQSSFGGYSNQIEWKQINTPMVRIIFMDSLENRAQRVANIIHYMNEKNVGLLGEKRKKVDIILRNRDAISNGYAQIAPLKSEFFMQAPQNTFEESSVDWTDQLAIHEYRHINQFVNARRGIGKAIYLLFGDYGWGAILGLTMPAWFLEGDATITETALSSGGRGRVPSFSVEQRAQQEAGVEYSYMKAMNGSYKDFVPNHYNTGYAILSEMRRNTKNHGFDEITRRASSFKGIFYPFKRAVKNVTGRNIKDHYLSASADLKANLPKHQSTSTILTKLKKNDVVQYNNPILENGELYFSYRDRTDIRGIYKYSSTGNHQRIVYKGLSLDSYFCKSGKYFVWEELQRDIRRGNQNFANIVLYDSEAQEKRIIGRGQSYRSPSFSRDGKNLIFVNAYLGSNSGISMMNIETNAMLSIIKSNEIQFLYPIASADGKSIYSVAKKRNSYALVQVALDGTLETLTDWDDIVFGPIKLSARHLIFQANIGNTDQIHAFDLDRRVIKTISNDPIGMYNPSNLDGGRIIAERPHEQGFLLHEITTDPSDWLPSPRHRSKSLPHYLETHHLEPDNILEKVASEEFEVTKYRRNFKMFRPHSWLLNYDGTQYSASLFSVNILNQVSFETSLSHLPALGLQIVSANINYGRWFPIYQLRYSYNFPIVVNRADDNASFRVSQQFIQPGVVIPLNLTKGIYSTRLNISSSVSQSLSYIEERQSKERFDIQGTTFNNGITLSSTRFRGQQNMFPRWGYSGVLRNRYRFNDGHNMVNLSNDFYLPGLSRNHGFRFEFDYARQNEVGERRFSHVDIFNYAHGFRATEFDQLWSFNTNYAFPVAYPDWGFADFIYFKRIKSTLFHNYNSIMLEGGVRDQQSMGVDLLFDVVFINNIFSEITVGFRNAYMLGILPEGKTTPYHFEFLIDIPAF